MPTTRLARLHWNAHTRCNLPCPFCYLWRRHGVHGLSDLDARSLVEQSAPLVQSFIFGGGDPLQRPDLPRLCAYASDLGLKVELQTNARLLTAAVAARVLPRLTRCGLSLDGPTPALHDSIRNAPGNFDEVAHALHLCDAYHVPTTVRTLVCKSNAAHLAPIGHLLALHSSVDKWSLRQFVALGRGARTADRFMQTEEVFLRATRVVVRSHAARHWPFRLAVISSRDMDSCYALIAEDGSVYSHPSDGVYRSVGVFPSTPLQDLLHSVQCDPVRRQRREELGIIAPHIAIAFAEATL